MHAVHGACLTSDRMRSNCHYSQRFFRPVVYSQRAAQRTSRHVQSCLSIAVTCPQR
jgi:hypothetical protein